jgi:peptidoglycan hydrolase CwlO-like protein
MSELNSTLLSVILLLGACFIVAAIIVLFRITKTIASMQTELTALTRTVIPLVERMNSLTVQVEDTLEIVTEHRNGIAESIDNIRRVTRNIARIQQLVQNQIKPPLAEFASLLAGIRKGVGTFAERWRRSHE